jgi:hypothetical protein
MEAVDQLQHRPENHLYLVEPDSTAAIEAPNFAEAFAEARLDLKLETPLLSECSDDVFEAQFPLNNAALMEHDQPLRTDFPPDLSGCKLASVLEQSRITANRATEDESLDTFQCALKLLVPSLAMDSPIPEWDEHTTSPERQYAFLRRSLPEAFRLPCSDTRAIVNPELRWNPVPKDSTVVQPWDSAVSSNGCVESYLLIKPLAKAYTISHIGHLESFSCFQISLMDEEAVEIEGRTDINPRTIPTSMESRFFANSNDTTDPQTWENDSRDLSVSSKSIVTQHSRAGREKYSETAPCIAPCVGLPRALVFKKQHRALRRPQNGGNTHNLLEAFMQLRGQKRPRMEHRGQLEPRADITQVEDLAGEGSTMAYQTVLPLIPPLEMPLEKGCFIVSLALGRRVLKYLDERWPRDLLIDRDYDRQLSAVRPCEKVLAHEPMMPCHEADVSLTPNVGIIVTTMSQASQKPLPNSKKLTPFRQQVQIICEKYESIFILVSENNPFGEVSSLPTPSDAAAYTDFVQFTTSLPNKCSCTFVPGASETLGQWIILMMCRYSSQAVVFKELLNPTEMSWEVFFRRTGMNVMSSQVLAGKLMQDGKEGLSRFLRMTTQEKLMKFGDLVGKTALVKTSQVLDRRWS